MGLTNLLKERRGRVDSPHVKSRRNDFSPAPALSTQENNELEPVVPKLSNVPSDAELLKRARDAHISVDFSTLAEGPEANGAWKCVESAGRFAVHRRLSPAGNRQEVMCVGQIEASIEEVASILRSTSEAEHNTVMTGLYAKSFIFGSYEREVPCSEQENQEDDEDDDVAVANEQLAVKTKSFSRSTMLGRNEQWCYFDYFQRDEERDGFTISKRALPPLESTPSRIVGGNARVDQLHGLNASYLVSKAPNQKGLRVVFHAWFDLPDKSGDQDRLGKRKGSRRRSDESSTSLDYADTSKHKAQLRRLVAMAHGVTKLPDLVHRRRFGVQVPADLAAVQASNSRCPCCTHKLAPVKLFLKSSTRRCYLCGYLVCMDCWRPEHMECAAGRVAAIVVCTRCHANVHACEYAEVFAGTAADREKHRGPARVVEDQADTPTVSLLVDFLSASLSSATSGSPEHAAVMAVIRTLLRQSGEDSGDEYASDDDGHENNGGPRFKVLGKADAVGKVGEMLSDSKQLPELKACKLGNAEKRSYALDLPDDPTVNVPRSPIPSNEDDRIASAEATGLLHLANRLAPELPATDSTSDKPDIYDLELLCRLAVKTLGCTYSFVTIMGSKHEHVLAGTHPGFAGAAVPREQTTCQHALMSPYPFMVSHHEADVRFHKQGATSQLPVRFYVGFPVKVPVVNGAIGDPELTVGMLCCVDAKPRAEITRTQYATMNRLASTAKCFLLQKSQRLQPQ